MKNLVTILAFSLLMTSCQGESVNVGKIIREFFSLLIMGGFAYSGGVLALGYLTDMKWVKRHAEERKENLMWMAGITLVMIVFDEQVQQLLTKVTNLFGLE